MLNDVTNDVMVSEDAVTDVIDETAEVWTFDIKSGLIGAGIVIGARIVYKTVPKIWKKLTSKAAKKDEVEEAFEDEDDFIIEDIEDDDTDTGSTTTQQNSNTEQKNKNKNKNK